MEIIKYSKAKFEKNKLTIYEDITIDEWKELGQGLRQVEGSVQFWIGDWARYGDKRGFTGKYTDPKVYDELEEITGLSHGTLKNYKSIAENIGSSLRNDDLSFNHHVEVAKLPPEKQEQFLQLASDEKLSVRELRSEIRKDGIEFKKTNPLTGKYRIVYADPPWNYGDKQDTPLLGGAQKHYPTMTIEQLCQMPINDITEDNAVLFLWVTSPILNECFDVINAWGFDYKSSFVWDKIKHNMGHYNSVRHEFLLICTKGSCTPDVLKLHDSVISEERTEHSKKPDIFRAIIDEIYTFGSKIELFARDEHDGWYSWGNEV